MEQENMKENLSKLLSLPKQLPESTLLAAVGAAVMYYNPLSIPFVLYERN